MTYAEEKLLIFFGQVRPPLWNYFKPVKAPPLTPTENRTLGYKDRWR